MKRINVFLVIMLVLVINSYSQDTLSVLPGTVIEISNTSSIGVQGTVFLQNGSTLINNGGLYIQKYSSNQPANFTNLNTNKYRMGLGTLYFQSSGTGLQQIQSSDTISRIEVNTDSLQLLSNIIADYWVLIKGKINTDENYAIVASPAQLAVQAYITNNNFTNGWFNGRLRRYIAPDTVSSYIFPIGNSNGAKQAEMINLSDMPLSGVSFIDAAFRNKRGTDAGLNVAENNSTYVSINNGGTWFLTPNATPTSGRYGLKLYFNGFSGLSDNLFGILKRADSSSSAVDWIVPTNSSLNGFNQSGRKVIDGFAQRNNITGFSQFGIGTVTSVFPVVLGNFNASRINKNTVQLLWNTLIEENVNGFIIERRLEYETDYKHVSFILSKAMNGNSNQPLSYSHADNNSYNKLSYYRLKMIDKNNDEKYSAIKAVKGWGDKEIMFSVYPNPANSFIRLETKGQFSNKLEGYLTDLSGKVVMKFAVNNGINNINIQHLSSGGYVLVCLDAFGKGQHFSEKIEITR